LLWKSIPSQRSRENKKFIYKVAKEGARAREYEDALLAPSAFAEGNRLFSEFKGALSENYVLQALQNQFEVTPRYWSVLNPSYEVDFLIQRENDVFPVEVKSEDNLNSASLKKYKEIYSDKVKLRIRFSLDNLKLDDDLLNIPLFMADYADKLIGLAMKQK
jgi:uncharacterized protein